MKKTILAGLALSFALSGITSAFAADVNMDAPYGDRLPGGYQHLTTHYHNYWRNHHHPWSNIERERHVVRAAQDFENLTKVWEGKHRDRFVRISDDAVKERFREYVWNEARNDYNSELPTHFVEQLKNRPSVSSVTKESLKLHAFLPQPLTYNDITYLPDDFTREQLRLPDQRYRSGIIGKDMVLYDVVTGRVRGLWRDMID